MHSQTLKRIEVEAAMYGLVRANNIGHHGHKQRWIVRCSKCPAHFAAYWNVNSSPELMVKTLRFRHWDVGRGDRPLCPKCAHPRADKSPDPKPGENYKDVARALPMTSMTSALITGAKKFVDPAPAKIVHVSLPPNWKLITQPQGHVRERVERNKDLPTWRWLNYVRPNKGSLLYVYFKRSRSGQEFQKRLPDPHDAEFKSAYDAAIKEFESRVWMKRKEEPPVTVVKHAMTEPSVTMATIKQKIEEKPMMNGKTTPQPTPKISHAVFQALDDKFDPQKRLYRLGYTDARIAGECNTSEEVVAFLRRETFGELAEDPRLSSLRDDIELYRMEAADFAQKMITRAAELQSRVDQYAMAGKVR